MDLAFDSKVGRGAFADVWLATDSLGRSVAVKFFNDTDPSQAEKNALVHAKALARVHHPAVVQVLSLERQPHPDTNAECMCIIVEYVNGPNLSLHQPALSSEHARAILLDVGGALDAIHAAGLVHGDLHEGNIVITKSGAKVIDIFYTHSLAEVGTRTSSRTREDDLRDLSVLFRQVLVKCGHTGRLVEEAYYRARDTPHSVFSVQRQFLDVLETAKEPSSAETHLDTPLVDNRSEQPITQKQPMDFSKYTDDDDNIDVGDLTALFYSLDRKGSHVTPRDPQKEALIALTERAEDQDIVLKMSTGYGKTTVALVYLYSHMLRSGKPVVYLCPTTQLVQQVLREATKLSINATYYPRNQSHPDPDATAGKAIIVCTYDKLFNAKTTFDRDDVSIIPEAIVLDDAHSGIQEVRDAFTIRIDRSDHPELYDALLGVLRAPCKAGHPSEWAGIELDDEKAVIDLPCWIWSPLLEQVRPILEERYQAESTTKGLKRAVLFQWGYLRKHLRWCRCVIAGGKIEILLDVPAVQRAKPFAQASHRLFMSATLSDDSALVRELGCDPNAAKNPITPPSDAGVGERMVLIPSLIEPKLDHAWVMDWCKSLAGQYRVVVLTPSEDTANAWAKVGAKVCTGDDVAKVVDELKTGACSFAAFAQRYDGIDLPDEACRVLVLDGMPVGHGVADELDRKTAGRTGGAYRRWVYRVEQGMGRAVRSQADYAAVIITGDDLVHFLAKKEVLELMGSATRAQLKASEKLTSMAKADKRPRAHVVHETVLQCLTRDPGWKSFYDKNVKRAISTTGHAPDTQQIDIASAEQQAQRAAMANQPQKAASILGDAINTLKPASAQVGWMLQRKANYAYDYDPAEGLKTQAAAYEYNEDMHVPPAGVSARKLKPGITAASMVLAWYNTFDHPNGVIAAFSELRTKLSFDVKPRVLEEGLSQLATFFGARGSRPEKQYGRGPDDLWEWPTFSWVIEAKSDRQDKLAKVDGGQLHSAMRWFEENFPERRAAPIVVARKARVERDAFFPDDTRVLTDDGLALLVNNVDAFVRALIQKEPIMWTPEQVGQALVSSTLAAEQFANAYTELPKK